MLAPVWGSRRRITPELSRQTARIRHAHLLGDVGWIPKAPGSARCRNTGFGAILGDVGRIPKGTPMDVKKTAHYWEISCQMAVNLAVALEYRATNVLCGEWGPHRTFLPKGFVQFARTCTCDPEIATPGKCRSPSAPGAVRRVGRVWALRTVFPGSAGRERTPWPECGQVWRVRAPRLVFWGSGACVWPGLACLSS